MALEQTRDRVDRADAHLVRLAPGRHEAAEDAERLQAAPGGFLVAHDHGGAGTVRELAGVAGGDEAALADRLEAGETFGGGFRTRTLILRQRNFLEGNGAGRLVGHAHGGLDGSDLIVELAALLRGRGTALAFQRVFVLLLARDAITLRHHFRGVQHRHVDVGLDLHQFRIDSVELVDVIVLHQADRFTAATDSDLDAVENHRTRSERNRLQAGRTLPVDGGAADGDRKTGAQRRLASDVAAGGALLHRSAHDHVLDLLGIDLGAGDGLTDRMSQQGRAFGVVERAAIGLADRGAGGGDDHCIGHDGLPCCCGLRGSRILLA